MSFVLYLASDHAGYDAKIQLIQYLYSLNKEIKIIDVGCNDTSSVDYPDYAKKLVEQADFSSKYVRAIVICGSGIGIQISMNRHEQVKCCLVHNELEVIKAKEIGSNSISMGGRILGQEQINKLALAFLTD
jgi:ribose 5-phosphate isomerase B